MDFLRSYRNVLYGGRYIDLFVLSKLIKHRSSLYLYVNHTSIKKEVCTLVFIAALFTIAKKVEIIQISTDRRMGKQK